MSPIDSVATAVIVHNWFSSSTLLLRSPLTLDCLTALKCMCEQVVQLSNDAVRKLSNPYSQKNLVHNATCKFVQRRTEWKTKNFIVRLFNSSNPKLWKVNKSNMTVVQNWFPRYTVPDELTVRSQPNHHSGPRRNFWMLFTVQCAGEVLLAFFSINKVLQPLPRNKGAVNFLNFPSSSVMDLLVPFQVFSVK